MLRSPPPPALWCGLVVLALFFTPTLPPVYASEQAVRTHLLSQKLRLLDALLERSRKGAALSSDEQATLEVARTLTHVARQDLSAADLPAVHASLDEALRLIGEVSRHSARRSAGVDKRGYSELRKTVLALSASFSDVVATRALKSAGLLDMDALRQNLAAADELAARAQYAQASAAMRRAYQPLVGALAELRNNETVRYQLVFASVDAELDYERRRLKSNELLVDLMLRERQPDAARRPQIDTEIGRALHMKTISERQSGAGDIKLALESAEIANGHLIRVLRKLGVYMGP